MSKGSARACFLLALTAGTLLVGLVGTAVAQTTSTPASTAPGTSTSTAPPGPEVFGKMQAGGEPVEGVDVTIRRNGTEVGSATSAADGTWAIPVPRPGRYDIALDASTLPEGVELRPGTEPERSLQVFGGLARQAVGFQLRAEGEQEATGPSRFERLLNLFAGGVTFGLIVGLCSVGLSLIYGTTGLVNFAHGELVTFGALVAWFFSTSDGGPEWPLAVAAVITLALSGLFGGGLELGLFRPMVHRRSGAGARMLVSIGLAMFLRYSYQLVFGSNASSYAQFSAQSPTKFGPLELPIRDYFVCAICIVALALVGWALQRTRLGTAVRAVSDDRDLSESSGIDVGRVVLSVWVSGTALAGLGGIMLGVTQNVQWNMGFRLLLTMFAAVVLGGLGSAYGAMVGGLVVGIAAEMSTYWFAPEFKFAVALAILIIVLLVRPQGILGVRERVG